MVERYSNTLRKRSQHEQILLEENQWNDFGYRTLFEAYYSEKNARPKHIGTVRIADIEKSREIKTESSTKTYITYKDIDAEFKALGKNYVSLGDEEYYDNLYKYLGLEAKNVLAEMNDLALKNDLLNKVKEEAVIEESFLRTTSMFTIEEDLQRMASGGDYYTDYNFKCVYYKSGKKLTSFEFIVEHDSVLPKNIHAIIGKNGSGKTSFIKDLVEASVNKSTQIKSKLLFSENKDEAIQFEILSGAQSVNENNIENIYDVFESVLFISFSAFDNFDDITESLQTTDEFSYVGLYNENEKYDYQPMDYRLLNNKYKETLEEIEGSAKKLQLFGKELQRLELFDESEYKEIYQFLISKDPKSTSDYQKKIREKLDDLQLLFNKASSGQRIVLLGIASLIAKVTQHTLVIIDEPELYLHPPLLSNYMRSISAIMKETNGICILATHSPIVLQEVPKECVNIISRDANTLFDISKPQKQTFGENISTLTDTVFELDIEESGFYNKIKELVKEINNNNIKEEEVDNIEFGTDGDLFYRLLKETMKYHQEISGDENDV